MSDHPCGLVPVEFNVIIDQNPVEEKIGSIIVPQQTQDVMKHSATRGTIVAVSPMAWSYAEWPKDAAPPKVGAKVAFAQHAGAFIDGNDGKKYRIVKDKDVLAVVL